MPTPRRRVVATVRRACCTPEADACVCTPEEVLGLLARPYALVILSLLRKHGRLRFGELEARVEGATAKALTARLRELESGGILARRRLPGAPPRVEYSLTPHGEELYGALGTLLFRHGGPPP